MPDTFTKLLYHVVFSTKDRAPVLGAELREELYKYIGGIVAGEKGVLLEIGGVEDHVHLVLRLKTDHSLAEIMRRIKGNSSKWINEQKKIEGRFEWQVGFGAFTVRESQLQSVRQYVRGQEEHHRTMSFKEEFVAMLKRHGLEFDEKWIWK